MIEEYLTSMVERFNRHVQHNPALGHELKGRTRTIELRLTDGGTYRLLLKESHLSMPGGENGAKADIEIVTDTPTFEGLVNKEIGPMKALFTRKLAINASLEDKILLRRLL